MPRRFRLRSLSALAVVLLIASAVACSRGPPPDTGDEPSRDPIPVHVRNQNFLDMNVFVVVGGMSRRLGMVTGNSETDFTIPWSVAYAQSISLLAVPIGGSGRVNTGSLNVGEGEMIDLTIGAILSQSAVTVHEPN